MGDVGMMVSMESMYSGVGLERREPFFPLRMASFVFSILLRARSYLYQKGLAPVRRLPVRVVSVGNLTLGGSGKTPTVMALAKAFREDGLRTCVISRGYRRLTGRPITRVSDGTKVLCDVEEAGDEPFMMAQRLKGVEVWVGKRRHCVGMAALENKAFDVLLLDDGFQHRALYRDVDVLVLKASNPYGNGRLFPAGVLREPAKEAQRADIWIINATGYHRREDPATNVIGRSHNPKPTFTSCLIPSELWVLGSGQRIGLEELRGKEVGLVCGIASPEGLVGLIGELGGTVIHCVSYPDHHWYNQRDLNKIRSLISKAQIWVTTEKDAWKFIRHRDERLNGLLVLATEMRFCDEHGLYGTVMDMLFKRERARG